MFIYNIIHNICIVHTNVVMYRTNLIKMLVIQF